MIIENNVRTEADFICFIDERRDAVIAARQSGNTRAIARREAALIEYIWGMGDEWMGA